MKNFRTSFEAIPDSFDISLQWDNHEKILNKGNFETRGKFKAVNGKPGKTLLTLNLMPGEFYLENKPWKINPARVMKDSTSLSIGSFNISNEQNYLLIDGAVSENIEDTLHLRFNGINLNPINGLYEKKMGNSPDMIHLSIGGTLNGRVSLTNLYRNFMFESDIRLKDFALLESRYGEIRIGSVWNRERKVAEIHAWNNLEGIQMFDVNGYYDPGSGKMNLAAIADKLPMDIMNPLLKIFASEIRGYASGKVYLSGEPAKPLLNGSLFCSEATMKIDYIQTKYSFNDSIIFDNQGIKFRNIQFRDDRGNPAFLNGTVYHKYFKDFTVDLSVRTADCMVLNTRSKDNELFYGTAFASGVTSLKSSGSLLRFDISAKTGRNTRFFIPLTSGLSVSENTFVSFVKPVASDSLGLKTVKASAVPAASSTAIEIAFDLEVTPESEVQL
jgi:hypothetical protein